MTSTKLEQQSDTPGDVVTPSRAAQMLESSLGGLLKDWILRLTNWRRPERQSPLPWHPNKVGRPVYNFDDVQKFIDRTLAQRTAVTPPATGPGRAKATATQDIADGTPFVRVFWNAGAAQGAFSLSIPAAKEFATKLTQAATASEELQKVRTQ